MYIFLWVFLKKFLVSNRRTYSCHLKILSTVTLIIFLSSAGSIAQSTLPKPEMDSLWSVWSNPQEVDSNRFRAISRIAWHGYLFSQPDSAFYFAQLCYDFLEEKDLIKQMSAALNIQATALNFQGDYENALDYYTRSMEISENLEDRQGIAVALNN